MTSLKLSAGTTTHVMHFLFPTTGGQVPNVRRDREREIEMEIDIGRDREKGQPSCIAFYDLALDVTQCHFHCILIIEAVTKFFPGSRGGEIVSRNIAVPQSAL